MLGVVNLLLEQTQPGALCTVHTVGGLGEDVIVKMWEEGDDAVVPALKGEEQTA